MKMINTRWLFGILVILLLCWIGLFPFGCNISITDLECSRSQACTYSGLCSTGDDGKCIALTENDCQGSFLCGDLKYCYPHKGECSLLYHNYCESSQRCASDGLCNRNFGKSICEAKTQKDCLNSVACKDKKRCFMDDGVCIEAGIDSCSKAKSCKTQGLCSFGEKNKTCVASKDKDCEENAPCRKDNRCYASKGVCVQLSASQTEPSTEIFSEKNKELSTEPNTENPKDEMSTETDKTSENTDPIEPSKTGERDEEGPEEVIIFPPEIPKSEPVGERRRELPRGERPRGERPRGERPRGERPRGERPRPGGLKGERPRPDGLKGERPPPDGGIRPPDGGIRPPDGGIRPPDGGIRPSDGGIRPPPDGSRPETLLERRLRDRRRPPP